MSCIIILMDQNNNHSFEVDEVIEVLQAGSDVGAKIRNNPKFKIIESDMELEEAQTLMEPEYDIFMNQVKQRSMSVGTRDILAKEIDMQRDEVVERIIVKDSVVDEQTSDVVVG